MSELQQQIDHFFSLPVDQLLAAHKPAALAAFTEFKAALNRGEVRAASRDESGNWTVHTWVKRGILLGFRLGGIVDCSINDNFRFFDKETYPLKQIGVGDGVRVVPGGSSVRDGAFLGRGVTIMPPAYINVGAFVDDGTMVEIGRASCRERV